MSWLLIFLLSLAEPDNSKEESSIEQDTSMEPAPESPQASMEASARVEERGEAPDEMRGEAWGEARGEELGEAPNEARGEAPGEARGEGRS